MTDRIAFWIGCIVIILLAVDLLMYDGSTSLYLARKLYDLSHKIAFWR